MTEAEYQAHLAAIKAGKIVAVNGRTAATAEQLDFIRVIESGGAKAAAQIALEAKIDKAISPLKAQIAEAQATAAAQATQIAQGQDQLATLQAENDGLKAALAAATEKAAAK